MALGLIVFPIDFVLKMVGVSGAAGWSAAYLRLAQAAFAPTALPTWLPRLVLLVLGAAGLVAAVDARCAGRARGTPRGPSWWRVLPAPLSPSRRSTHCWRVMWDLVRGADAAASSRRRASSARRYAEMLAENLGQPGFRELLIAVARRRRRTAICVFALVGEARRRDLVRRPTHARRRRRGAPRCSIWPAWRAITWPTPWPAALTVPLATDWHDVHFAADGYWRGETHRLCDRPASLMRLLDELVDLGVEQIILVSAAPESPGPHALAAPRLDGRGRLGEYLQSSEAAAVRDALDRRRAGVRASSRIRPAHNPIGPFDFAGGFDDRSDRRAAARPS